MVVTCPSSSGNDFRFLNSECNYLSHAVKTNTYIQSQAGPKMPLKDLLSSKGYVKIHMSAILSPKVEMK